MLRSDFAKEVIRLAELEFGPERGTLNRLATAMRVSRSTLSRLIEGKAGGLVSMNNVTLKTLQALSTCLRVSTTHWFEQTAKTVPGKDLWGSIVSAHPNVTAEEGNLVTGLLWTLRHSNDGQRKGMTSHISNLSDFVRKTHRRK
jgi:transcriptional regulator with XRE-family HTH domain